ncbi:MULTISPECIES: hypothetical protein [Luteimonas]|uniref:hypothetical protein n=1 Tax=Luteimonas TaxID=83614 RepID=UPI0013045D69|nr:MULTISPECIES: hypothetical protein [Luteimonas]
MGDGDRRSTDSQDALERLCELVRLGESDSTECAQLDHLIHERLRQAYAGSGDAPH